MTRVQVCRLAQTYQQIAMMSIFGAKMRPFWICLVSWSFCCYHNFVNINEILAKIRGMQSPLARQLYMVGLITRILEERGKPALPENDTLAELLSLRNKGR